MLDSDCHRLLTESPQQRALCPWKVTNILLFVYLLACLFSFLQIAPKHRCFSTEISLSSTNAARLLANVSYERLPAHRKL